MAEAVDLVVVAASWEGLKLAFAEHLEQQAEHWSVPRDVSAIELEVASKSAMGPVRKINQSGIKAVSEYIANGAIAQNTISMNLDDSALADYLDLEQTNLNPALLSIKTKFTCRRRGQETKIVAGKA